MAQSHAKTLREIRDVAASANWTGHSKAELFNLLTDIYHSANDALEGPSSSLDKMARVLSPRLS